MQNRDTSPSMPMLQVRHNNRLGALYECCYEFLKLRENQSDIVSCVLYQSDAKIIFSNEKARSSLVESHMMSYTADGGTNFGRPMQLIRDLVASTPSPYIPIVFFMTDGESGDDGASSVLSDVVARFGQTGFQFNAIAIGRSDHSVLRNLANIGNGKFSSSGINLEEMKNTYLSFAALLE